VAISDKDFRDLRDKVNSVSQTQDSIVIPALDEIKTSIGKLAFVSQKDHDRDMRDIRKEILSAVEDLKTEFQPTIDQAKIDSVLVNKGGVKATNAVFGKVGGIIAFALAIGILIAIVMGVFTLYPAIKGTVQ